MRQPGFSLALGVVLGIVMACSGLAGPSPAQAITVEGCDLFIGTTCTLAPVQIFVNQVDNHTSGDPRIDQPFAKVAISVTALAAQEFEYRYQIIDAQFTVTNFILDLSLLDPTKILLAGSIDDGDNNAATIKPLLASYDRPDPITNPQGSGFFTAVFIGPPIIPGQSQGSDVLFVRSTLSPSEVFGQLLGSDLFNALLGTMQLTGPGGMLTAPPVLPAKPIADAGPDQVVNEGQLVELDGSGSSDPQNDPLMFAWSQIAGPQVGLVNSNTAAPSFDAPFVAANQTLTFELVVSDGSSSSDPDTIDVFVNQVNSPPVADAGDDGTVKEGAVAALDGGNSFDPDGDPIGFTWTQVAGSAVALTPDNHVKEPTFIAPPGAGQVLVFKVEVTDGKEASVPSPGSDSAQADTVAVTVVLNSAPVADAGSDQTKDEGSLVALDGSGSSDPDGGDLLSFEWTQTSGAPVTLSGADGPAPTFDTPFVSPGGEALVFELVVTDNDPVNPLASSDEVVINVRNMNDPPTCGLAAANVDSLWPPNHKMESISIEGVMDDNSASNGIVLSITGVTQDEPVNGTGDGDTSPDAVVQHTPPKDTVMIRSERAGGGNGRVYEIHFTASDGLESCSGSAKVGVPHGRKDTPLDDGQVYDSTQP